MIVPFKLFDTTNNTAVLQTEELNTFSKEVHKNRLYLPYANLIRMKSILLPGLHV